MKANSSLKGERVTLPTVQAAMAIGAALVTGCAATAPPSSSGFLRNHGLLKPSAYENVALFRAAGFDAGWYGRVIVDPTVMHGPSQRLRELTPELRTEVLAYIDREIAARLKAGIGDGQGVLLVRAAVTDIDTPNRAVNVLSSLLLAPVTTGGASLEVELSDAESGKVLVAATCSDRGSVIKQFAGAYQVLTHAKSAISDCMGRFERAYRQQAEPNPAAREPSAIQPAADAQPSAAAAAQE